MFLLGFLFFFFKELSAQTGENIYDVSCYNRYDKGVTFNGTVSTGFFNNRQKTCRNWKIYQSQYTKYYPDHSYCRNPRPDAFDQPWCYTGDTLQTGKCNIPVCDCRNSTADLKYNGSINTTRNGNTCHLWTATRYKNQTANYCRTPHNDRDNAGGPWCYVDSGWERCNIPICGGSFCPDLLSYHLLTLDKKSKYQYGEIAIVVSCQKGYRHIEKTYLECFSTGTWNDTVPTCEEITCQPFILDNNVHASIQPDLNKYDVNTKVTLSCIPGYRGSHKEASCLPDGQWSSQQTPICTRVTCGPLNTNISLDVEPKKPIYDYNETVKLTCKSGFTGKEMTAVCTQAGYWSKVSPICKHVKCDPAVKNISVGIEPIKAIYDYNETIRMTCNPGFTGVEVTAVCTQAGNWSETQPVCKPLQCPPLSLPKDATSKAESSTFYYGENVHFWCKHGYNLKGTGSANCTFEERSQMTVWNYDSQSCEGVLCPQPNVSDNNLIWGKNKTEYRYPDHIKFDCLEGFELDRQEAVGIDCVVDEYNKTSGKWKGEVPVCQAITYSNQHNMIGPAVGGGTAAAFVIIIIIVIVLIFVMKRRTTPPKKNKDDTRYKESKLELNDSHIYSQVLERETKPHNEVSETNDYDNDEKEDIETGGYYAFTVGSQLPKDAIEIDNFYKYVEKGRGKEGDIEKEFQNLKSGLQKSTDAALKPGNRLKNKYKDMYAYDETRVILDKPKESHNSDYINASFIQGYGQVRKYIAAQGPLDKTVDDFWRMVWQCDCGKIAMLTNVFENGKQKCIQYWPDHEQERTDFGSISLLLVKEDMYSDFTIRRLKLQKENETKTVLQFHFTAWPDKDVPKYASSLVHFRHKVNTTRTLAKGPLVVHCSAGVGRTGTYIALDYIVNEAKQRNYVEVFRSVEILRNQRVNMVQTAHQYLFLHEAVLEALMCPNSGIPCRDFPDNYTDLMRFDNSKKKHKLQIEFELMNSVSSRHDEEAFSKGKSEENRGKNRYSNIIPVGSEMPLLSTAVDGRNEYINAVFLPGYRNNKTFIVTQMPLEMTVVDLWRLVYDYEIPTIVMLNTDVQTVKSTNVYWPEGDKQVTFGPFNITRKNTSTQNLYTSLDLTYKYKNQESRQVKLFQSKFWEENMINPGSTNDMLSFLSATEDEHSSNRGCGPVLVHCLNGCDKSGLFCVLATVIERLRIEQDVDIQHIIKQMRNRRPQIIPNYEQFQFIYEAVIEYLKEFEMYSNFQ